MSGFLDIIHNSRGDSDYEGDEFGGARGDVGRARSDERGQKTTNAFCFATGIECSYPTIQNGRLRRDELQECGHYERWREDLALVKEMGIRALRYGLPYHKTHLGPGKYDWEFADLVMAEIQRLEIIPILDLLHFGVPDWLGNFQNPELPMHFADYAAAVARRYPWVRFYTPVNEVYVAANFSGRLGVWNEQLKSDEGFVTALKHLSAASILANHDIVKQTPNAVIVQSETAEYVHDLRAEPDDKVALGNKLLFLALDLLYGHAPDADVYEFLLDNGMSRDEFRWFMQGEPPGHQIMGNDYYGRNEKIILPSGEETSGEDVLGWYQITKRYYERYKKPVMHTETNHFDPDMAPNWLWKQWTNILRMRSEGVPVVGFTWYSLTDQIDWDSGMGEKNDRVNACGLYDLDRRPRPVAHAYKQLIQEFGGITTLSRGEMFELTDQPARLRFER